MCWYCLLLSRRVIVASRSLGFTIYSSAVRAEKRCIASLLKRDSSSTGLLGAAGAPTRAVVAPPAGPLPPAGLPPDGATAAAATEPYMLAAQSASMLFSRRLSVDLGTPFCRWRALTMSLACSQSGMESPPARISRRTRCRSATVCFMLLVEKGWIIVSAPPQNNVRPA